MLLLKYKYFNNEKKSMKEVVELVNRITCGSNKANLYSFEFIVIEWLIQRKILNSNFNSVNTGVTSYNLCLKTNLILQ
jgi:hypothetical protein